MLSSSQPRQHPMPALARTLAANSPGHAISGGRKAGAGFGRREATGRLLGRSPVLGQETHTNATLRSFSTRAKPGARRSGSSCTGASLSIARS